MFIDLKFTVEIILYSQQRATKLVESLDENNDNIIIHITIPLPTKHSKIHNIIHSI